MRVSSLITAIKATRQLGFTQVALNALYHLGLASGHYRRSIHRPEPIKGLRIKPILPLPPVENLRAVLGENGEADLMAEAGEIASGRFRQFGAEPVELQLTPESPLADWTLHESGKIALPPGLEDIKLIWEPARFGWAFTLGRAYHLTANEGYSRAFWNFFDTFLQGNPPYQGPNWTSGQEAGLRLMASSWAATAFADSAHSTPARLEALANAIATHAARIPGTLVYARSQNNNHLLTEAAALYTAALALPDHPEAAGWLAVGKKWLRWCFTHQIDETGEYVQHSMNYQRLMLQTALWVRAITRAEEVSMQEGPFDEVARQKLALATQWLLDRLDPQSGQVPNLGANDGALIFPLSSSKFGDFRPTAQAAARAFLDGALPAGPWDEASLWFGLTPAEGTLLARTEGHGILQAEHSWATLRAVQYHSRPSHADQLHCDLWWRGLNIALDPGTYRYNAAPPWDNRLTSTLVHNTVSVNNQEQMTRAGRFLYLDWAEASFVEPAGRPGESPRCVTAQTSAYARLGVRHQRSLSVTSEEHWRVEDQLSRLPSSGPKTELTYRLHWLLPDWEWKLETHETGLKLQIKSPHGWVSLAISTNRGAGKVSLLRAGELIFGAGLISPIFGWYSPTYNIKKPALSLAVEVKSALDVNILSEFIFPVVE